MSDHSFDPAFLRLKQGLDKDLQLINTKKAEIMRLESEVTRDEKQIETLKKDIQTIEQQHRMNLEKISSVQRAHEAQLKNPNLKIPPHR